MHRILGRGAAASRTTGPLWPGRRMSVWEPKSRSRCRGWKVARTVKPVGCTYSFGARRANRVACSGPVTPLAEDADAALDPLRRRVRARRPRSRSVPTRCGTRCRAPRPAARGPRAAPDREAVPLASGRPARADHPESGPATRRMGALPRPARAAAALAPRSRPAEVDRLRTASWSGSTAAARGGARPDRPARRRERELGLPARPRRAPQAGPRRLRHRDPDDASAERRPAGAPPDGTHLAYLPPGARRGGTRVATSSRSRPSGCRPSTCSSSWRSTPGGCSSSAAPRTRPPRG
jgi:hypothetical protein